MHKIIYILSLTLMVLAVFLTGCKLVPGKPQLKPVKKHQLARKVPKAICISDAGQKHCFAWDKNNKTMNKIKIKENKKP